MSGPSPENRPVHPHQTADRSGEDGAEIPAEIPAAIEEQILAILDETEPGADRDAALARLPLADTVRTAVEAWLAADAETQVEAAETIGTERGSSGGLPRQLGEYLLESVLGRGGMGIVYRARDLSLGRVVALKVLPERFVEDEKRKNRFEREMRAVAGLNHPAIVPVFAADPTGEVPYYTMELVTGLSLDKVIHTLAELQRPVSNLRFSDWLTAIGATRDSSSSETGERTYLEAVCKLLIQIAGALQHAHDNGVTHRDVKPSNIIAEGSGQARLFDFGLARLDDGLAMTQTSEIIGSPHYMSPEQIDGRDVGPRSDIYSLGVTMYELLTLHVPFESQTPQQVYQAILTHEPRRPALLNPQLPIDVETICLTAMEKDADRRFATAAEFAEDLRRFLRFEPIHARPIGSMTRSIRWLRRNRTPVSIIALVLIAVIAVFFMRDTQKQVQSITTERDLVIREADRLRTETQIAAAKLQSLRDSAQATETILSEQRKALSEINNKLAESRAAIQQQEAISRQLATKNQSLTKTNAQLQQASEAQTAELQRLRTVQSELETGQAKLVAAIAREQAKLRTAGARLEAKKADFTSLERNFRLSTVKNILAEARTLQSTHASLGLLLATEAAQIADAENAGPTLQARVDDTLLALLATTQEERALPPDSHLITAVGFSPAGNRIVSTTAGGIARIWERDTGMELATLDEQSIVHVEYVAENWLLLAGEDGSVFTWNGSSGSVASRVNGSFHQEGTRRHVDPTGRFLVAHESAAPGQLVVHRRGSLDPERRLGDPDHPIVGFSFGAAGERVLVTTTQRTAELWNLNSGARQLRIQAPTGLLATALDGEGRRIAALDHRGVLHIYSIADSAELLAVDVNEGKPIGSGRIAFCASDTRILVHAVGMDFHVLFDARNGEVRSRHAAHRTHRESWLDPQGTLLCIPDPAGGYTMIHTLHGQVFARLGPSDPAATHEAASCAFSPDRRAIVTADAHRARIWRTHPGGILGLTGPQATNAFSLERLRYGKFDASVGRAVTISNLGLGSWHFDSGLRFLAAQDSQRPLTPQAIDAFGGGVTYLEGALRRLTSGPRSRTRIMCEIDAETVDQVLSWPGGGAAAVLSQRDADAPRQLLLVDESGQKRRTLDLPSGRGGGGTPLPSPDGSRFAIGYDALTLVDTAHPTRRIRLPYSQRPVRFSPNGRRIAASTGFGIKIWNARTGGTWCEIPGSANDQARLTDLEFAPDGNRLATAWSDGTVHLHDCGTRESRRLRILPLHRGAVNSIRFRHDGRLLLSAGADGTARVVDPDAPDRTERTFETPAPCIQAEFNAAGTWVLVLGERTIRRFPLDPRPLATASCPRRLTDAERKRYGVPAAR